MTQEQFEARLHQFNEIYIVNKDYWLRVISEKSYIELSQNDSKRNYVQSICFNPRANPPGPTYLVRLIRDDQVRSCFFAQRLKQLFKEFNPEQVTIQLWNKGKIRHLDVDEIYDRRKNELAEMDQVLRRVEGHIRREPERPKMPWDED